MSISQYRAVVSNARRPSVDASVVAAVGSVDSKKRARLRIHGRLLFGVGVDHLRRHQHEDAGDEEDDHLQSENKNGRPRSKKRLTFLAC